MNEINVNNCPSYLTNYKFTVVRDCDEDGFWYYCGYNDYMKAVEVSREIGNGIPIPTEYIVTV